MAPDVAGCTVFRIAADGSVTIFWAMMPGEPRRPTGRLLQASDGLLYGTSSLGGAFDNGAAFRLARDGSDFALLHSFARANGEAWGPFGELLETSPGVFIGTTTEGGRRNAGTVYQMLASGELTIVYAFSGRPKPAGFVDGTTPIAELTPAADGALLSVTQLGGAQNSGTVYRLRPQ